MNMSHAIASISVSRVLLAKIPHIRDPVSGASAVRMSWPQGANVSELAEGRERTQPTGRCQVLLMRLVALQ